MTEEVRVQTRGDDPAPRSPQAQAARRAAERMLVLVELEPEPEGEQYRFNVRFDGPDGGGLLLSLHCRRDQVEAFRQDWVRHAAGVIERLCTRRPSVGPDLVGASILDLYLFDGCPASLWQWRFAFVGAGGGLCVVRCMDYMTDPDCLAALSLRERWNAHLATIVREELGAGTGANGRDPSVARETAGCVPGAGSDPGETSPTRASEQP